MFLEWEREQNLSRLATALRSRTLAYTVVFCLAFLGLETWRELTSRDDAITHAQEDAANLARSLRQHADDTLQMAELAVAGLVDLFENEGVSEEAAQPARRLMAASLSAQDRLYQLAVFRADGTWLVNTSSVPSGESVSDRVYFRHHQQVDDGKTFFGPPIVGRVDGEWVLTISRRINDVNGAFAGVALATIASGYFADYYRRLNVGKRGSILLASTDGTVLSRAPYNAGTIGTDLSSNRLFSEILKTSRSGAYHYVSPIDQVERIGGYDKSERFGIVVVAAVSQQEALAPWQTGLLQRQLAAALFLGLVALLGVRLIDQLERRRLDALALRQKEEEFRLLAESASDLVERYDAEGIRRYVSPASIGLLGYTPEDLIGTSAMALVVEQDLPLVTQSAERLRTGVSTEETVSCRVRRVDGTIVWVETSLRLVPGEHGEEVGVVAVSRNITDRKELELQLAAMATIDGLTGLRNRRSFDAALEAQMAQARRSGTPISLLMVDVDRFKFFNDEYGHMAGDACLKSIATVVAAAAKRPVDVAARYGGEEMVVLLPDTNISGATFIAGEICRQIEALQIPHERNIPWQVATVSVGCSCVENRPGDPERDSAWLVSTADMALYQAKGEGRNRAKAAPPSITEFERHAS